MTRPLMYLAATPEPNARVPTLFSSEQAPVRQLLEHPPSTRYMGWNLDTLDRARIDRDRLVVSNGERKQVAIHEDGTLFAYAAFHGFLGHPRDDEQFNRDPRINPLALVEFTFNFMDAFSRLLEFVEPHPDFVILGVGFRNAHWSNVRLYLPSSTPGTFGFELDRRYDDRGAAPEANWDGSVRVSLQAGFDPETASFEILRVVYRFFGWTDDQVPYQANGGGRIDAAALRSIA